MFCGLSALVVGLTWLGSLPRHADAQYTCTPDWIPYDNTNVGEGTYSSSGTDLTACKAACAGSPTCTGIDWDSNPQQTRRCWLSGTGGQWFKGTAAGVTHYQIVRKTDCGSCPNIWTQYPNTNVQGGTYNVAATLADCQAACLALPSCTGIDWDPNNPSGQKCWLSGNGQWFNGTATGVTHYYRNTNCQTCSSTWKSYANTNVRGGTANAAATLADCQAACLATSGCTGIDWDPNNPQGQKCWLSGNGAWNNGTATGVTHYYPNTNCQTCSTTWTSYANTNVRGGTANAAATVADCQAACLATPGCIGIDWDPNNPSGQKCWLSGNGVWNNGTSYDVTHYYPKTICLSGTGLPASVTPPLSTGGPDLKCDPFWTSYTNTNVRGGTYNGATTVDDCKAACLALPRCTGIDWDPVNPDNQKCWLSGNGVWNNGTSTGVTHYYLDRNINCSNCPPIWTLYPNTNVRGGTYYAATNVADCQTACLASSSCTGIDWDPGNPDNQTCWLSGNGVWNNGTATGVTHYYPDRNTNCSGACNWTSYENTLVKGGSSNSATTEVTCKAACIASPTCTGIDWDPQNPEGNKCWLSGTGVWVRGTATGVTHYELFRTPTCRPVE